MTEQKVKFLLEVVYRDPEAGNENINEIDENIKQAEQGIVNATKQDKTIMSAFSPNSPFGVKSMVTGIFSRIVNLPMFHNMIANVIELLNLYLLKLMSAIPQSVYKSEGAFLVFDKQTTSDKTSDKGNMAHKAAFAAVNCISAIAKQVDEAGNVVEDSTGESCYIVFAPEHLGEIIKKLGGDNVPPNITRHHVMPLDALVKSIIEQQGNV